MTVYKPSNQFTIVDADKLAIPNLAKSFISGAGVSSKVRNNSAMNVLLLSLSQAANALGISRDTLNRLCRQKLLRSFHIGRRHFVSLDAIEEFIRNQEEAEQW